MSAGDPGSALTNLNKGDQLEPFEVCLTSDDIAAYLAATGEENATWDGAVPPLAIGAFALGGLMEQVGIPEGLLHSGQEFEFVRPVAHGAPVEVRCSVASHAERRGALMVAFDLELHGGGELVGTGRTSVIVPSDDGEAS